VAGGVVAGGNRDVFDRVGADEADFGVVILLFLFPLHGFDGRESYRLGGLVGMACWGGGGCLSIPSASPPPSTAASPAAVSLATAP
jgi:hypothetical protein